MSEMQAPEPSFEVTYRWADGGDLGDYMWSVTMEEFEFAVEDGDEPRDVLIERWERAGYAFKTIYPPLSTCSYEDDEPCEEDAVVWTQEPGDPPVWMQACERHRPPLSGRERP